MKTLYVSDLDGTLLGSDSRVSQRSAGLITDLSHDGALITVATARTPATVVPLLAQTATNVDYIVMTGAAGWSRSGGVFVDSCFLDAGEARRLLSFGIEHGVHPFVYIQSADGRTLDVYHAAKTLNRAEESFWLERRHMALKRFHLGTPVPENSIHRAMLFFAMGDRKPVEALARMVGDSIECSVSCYPDIFNSNIYNLEVLAPGVSKASAIRRVAKNVGAERIVVFGDNLNDLPMFAVADHAVAVGNAMPQVKAAADEVIEANYTDAVARYIAADYAATAAR